MPPGCRSYGTPRDTPMTTTLQKKTASGAAEGWVNRDVRWILGTQLMFGFAWSLYLLTPKFVATELHAGPDVIGRIASMGGLAGLLTVPFAAYGIDHVSRRLFFRLGTALIVLLSLGFMHVHAVGPLVFVLQGCVSAAFVLSFNSAAAMLMDHAPPERIGQAIGWLGGANVLMNAVATMIAEPLAASYGWNVVFELGVVAGCAAFALSFAARDAPHRPLLAAASSAPVREPSKVGQWSILFAAFMVGGVFIAMFGFVQPYALSAGAHQVRGYFLGFTISAVLGRVFFGGLGDRVGRRVVSLWMMVGYALAALLMRKFHADLLILYGLAFGAAHGILYPTLNALMLETLPSARRGLGMALYNGAFNLGSSVGSLAWGQVAKQHGYPQMYTLAACASLLAAAVLRFSRTSAA
jgi:MFS family permease